MGHEVGVGLGRGMGWDKRGEGGEEGLGLDLTGVRLLHRRLLVGRNINVCDHRR